MTELMLALKKQWFEMTVSGEKTEDYREITAHWCRRLLIVTEGGVFNWDDYLSKECDADKLLAAGVANNYFKFKDFSKNMITLGYPGLDVSERILRLEHKGIEIRTGKPEWGAEPGKLYFVIKHGAVLR